MVIHKPSLLPSCGSTILYHLGTMNGESEQGLHRRYSQGWTPLLTHPLAKAESSGHIELQGNLGNVVHRVQVGGEALGSSEKEQALPPLLSPLLSPLPG